MTLPRRRARTLLALAVIGAGATLAGCSTSPPALAITPSLTGPSTPGAPTTPAAAAAWEALMGPEGEYAASASYAAVLARFGQVQPYAQIQAAEERHIAALTRQLQRLGVTVPANPYLGRIAAPTDLAGAARAWATGEVKNVELYDRLLPAVADDPQLTRVFTNLRRASLEVHLPAFERAAQNGGTTSGATV